MTSDRVYPAVTGPAWMGGGVGSIQTELERLISSASSELLILTYAVSDGANALIDLLATQLRLGVTITIVVERLDTQYGQVPGRFRSLASEYPNTFRLFEFAPNGGGSLHAKAVIADRKHALIGSANLSFNGLVNNYELGVVIHGPNVEPFVQVSERILSHHAVRRIP